MNKAIERKAQALPTALMCSGIPIHSRNTIPHQAQCSEARDVTLNILYLFNVACDSSLTHRSQ